MSSGIRLIVGLGNPGDKYAATRHNAGAWFVEQLAAADGISLHPEPKFQGLAGAITLAGQKVWLLLPTTFMNHSGQSVRALSQFYQIPPESILIAHDELDFSPGVLRLKQAGGHGGHNGLRDLIAHLQTDAFMRLRIGIGHPGQRHQVLDYVLGRPSKEDFVKIMDALQRGIHVLPELVAGEIQRAIQKLHDADL